MHFKLETRGKPYTGHIFASIQTHERHVHFAKGIRSPVEVISILRHEQQGFYRGL